MKLIITFPETLQILFNLYILILLIKNDINYSKMNKDIVKIKGKLTVLQDKQLTKEIVQEVSKEIVKK